MKRNSFLRHQNDESLWDAAESVPRIGSQEQNLLFMFFNDPVHHLHLLFLVFHSSPHCASSFQKKKKKDGYQSEREKIGRTSFAHKDRCLLVDPNRILFCFTPNRSHVQSYFPEYFKYFSLDCS